MRIRIRRGIWLPLGFLLACQPRTVPGDAPAAISSPPLTMPSWQPPTVPPLSLEPAEQLRAAEQLGNMGPVIRAWAAAGPQAPVELADDTVRLAHTVIWAYYAQVVLPRYFALNRPALSAGAHTVLPDAFLLAATDSLSQRDVEHDLWRYRHRWLRRQRPWLPAAAQPVLYLDSARHVALRAFLLYDSWPAEVGQDSLRREQYQQLSAARQRLLAPYMAVPLPGDGSCFTRPWLRAVQITRDGQRAKVFWRLPARGGHATFRRVGPTSWQLVEEAGDWVS